MKQEYNLLFVISIGVILTGLYNLFYGPIDLKGFPVNQVWGLPISIIGIIMLVYLVRNKTKMKNEYMKVLQCSNCGEKYQKVYAPSRICPDCETTLKEK